MTGAASEHSKPRLARIIENAVLLMLAVPPFMILGWQMPRWAQGLDPAFMHPNFLARSAYPSMLRLATIHPVIWMLALLTITVRLCRNYGWSPRRHYGKQGHEHAGGANSGAAAAPPQSHTMAPGRE